jgi:sorting nexin-1/2
VSKLVKTEMARFEQERINDFKDSLVAFLEGMISRQKEVSNTESAATELRRLIPA